MKSAFQFALILVGVSGLANAQSRRAAPATSIAPTRVVATVPSAVDDASASPGGKFIAYSSEDGDDVRVLDVATGKSWRIDTISVDILRWSPAGDRIFVVRYAGNDPHIWSIPVSPATGQRTGEPRRLTVGPATSPFPSPDGKLVAYIESPGGRNSGLGVVPVNGGQEHHLTSGSVSYRLGWTPDNAFIYYGVTKATTQNNGPLDLFKISAAGGSPTAIGAASTSFPGLSNDGKYWFSLDEKAEHGKMTVQARVPGGDVVGSMTIPAVMGGASWLNVGYHALLIDVGSTWALAATPLRAGAKPTDLFTLPNTGEFPISALAASPDGKELAWETHSAAGVELWLANVDGSHRRVIDTLPDAPAGAFPKTILWSPDGAYMAYRSAGAPVPTIYIASRAGKKAASVTAQIGTVDIAWRADSRALRYVRQDGTPQQRRMSVHELSVDGHDRELLDLSKQYPQPPGLMFLDGNRVFAFRSGLVHSLDGSQPTPAVDVAVGRDMAWPVLSRDGKSVAYRKVSEGTRPTTLHIVSLGGTSAKPRDIALPAPLTFPNQTAYIWGPDDKSVIVHTVDRADQHRLYQIPLDGGEPRLIANGVPIELMPTMALSADGRTAYHLHAGKPRTVFIDADFGRAVSVPSQARKH